MTTSNKRGSESMRPCMKCKQLRAAKNFDNDMSEVCSVCKSKPKLPSHAPYGKGMPQKFAMPKAAKMHDARRKAR